MSPKYFLRLVYETLLKQQCNMGLTWALTAEIRIWDLYDVCTFMVHKLLITVQLKSS